MKVELIVVPSPTWLFTPEVVVTSPAGLLRNISSPSSVMEKESAGVIAMKGADDEVSEDTDPAGKLVAKGVQAHMAVTKQRNTSKFMNSIIGNRMQTRKIKVERNARRVRSREYCSHAQFSTMSFSFRRLYATLPKPSSTSALEARATSAPLQVRRRRLRKQLTAVSDPSATLSPLSPSEKERYTRLKRLGAFLKQENGSREPTEEEWLASLNDKRTRIRGARRRVVKDPDTGERTVVEDVVGQRIYLPNIIFRMMRNFTPPGEPYNPWEATFRVPNSLTKLDIRSYLFAVYGVKCTYIRTDNYFEPLKNFKRKHIRRQMRRAAYKRVVVGLVEPFYYPEALEDMDLTERQTREEWLNSKLQIDAYNTMRDTEMRRQWYNSTSWKPGNLVGPRGAILKAVMARQKAREQAAVEGAQAFLGKSSQRSVTEGAPAPCLLAKPTHNTTIL